MSFALFNTLCFIGTFIVSLKSKNTILMLILAIFALSGYALSNVITNAQYAIILGFFSILAFVFRHNFIILGISLAMVVIKYSFGVPLALTFLLLGYFRGVILAVIISLCACLIFQIKFGGGFLYNLFLSLKVNQSSLNNVIGPSDLMSLGHYFSQNFMYFVIALCYIAYIFIVLYARKKFGTKINESSVIASSLTLSLCSLYHLGYDSYTLYVALIILAFNVKKNLFGFIVLFLYSAFIFIGDRFYKIQEPKLNWAMSMGMTFTLFTSIALCVITFIIVLNAKNKSQADSI